MFSMPHTGLSSPSLFPRNRIPISQENAKPGVELPANYWCKETFGDPLRDQLWNVASGDSVARKRRHAVYVPRPPVWHPGPALREGQFPVFVDEEISGQFSEIDIDGHTELDSLSSLHVDALPRSFAQDNPDIASGQIPEDQVNFEQDLLRDVAAAVTDAQTTQSEGSGSEPGISLLVSVSSMG